MSGKQLAAVDALPKGTVYTVTQLNFEVRTLLEGSFPLLWVEGELSNLARPASGHLYFSLKDARCQVRCAMFRPYNRGLGFRPENGRQVLVRARVSLYPERGDFQLIVEYLEEAGAGALRRAFEALKQRLAAEGLFDESRKRPLPALPKQLGIITSPTGAAIRDILTVLKRRFPALPVLIYPVPVQGSGAAGEIARMLRLANSHGVCDVLILARGGGSLEDLWAFNEELVARAIAESQIPVVTGIGHEIDFTIADFVADRRAPTPSAAAELVTPDQAEWQKRITQLRGRLVLRVHARLQAERQRLAWLERRLVHPRRRLLDRSQRVDDLYLRLQRAVTATVVARRARLSTLATRLYRVDPSVRLQLRRARCIQHGQRLLAAASQQLERRRAQLNTLQRQLQAVSPLQTLNRGYAIVTRQNTGQVLRSAATVDAGERIHARLAEGALLCIVEEVSNP